MNILLADDDPVVTASLKIILEATGEVTVLGIGNSGNEAVELFREIRPDILLMDIRMGEMTGISAAKTILSEFPEARILFLTTFSDDDYIRDALKIGAKGYILKQDFEGIVSALKAVLQGKTVFCSDITERIAGLMVGNVPVSADFDCKGYGIGEKELEIIEKVSLGHCNKEIASELHLSEGTVRNYISNILMKLDLRDRTQLAVFYYERIKP
ncbi:MAG: response regulator transcription factor [Ruminococcaceae bacterium]|nr:response regulator transcription factor [Oscillospiraceae bacterium]